MLIESTTRTQKDRFKLSGRTKKVRTHTFTHPLEIPLLAKYAPEIYEILSERGDLTVAEVQALLHTEFLHELPTSGVLRVLEFLSRKKLITRTWRTGNLGLVFVYYKIVTSPSYHSHILKWQEKALVKNVLSPKSSPG